MAATNRDGGGYRRSGTPKGKTMPGKQGRQPVAHRFGPTGRAIPMPPGPREEDGSFRKPSAGKKRK